VLLEVLLAWGSQLEADKLETLSLKSSNDFSNKASLDTVGVDHDEGSLSSAQPSLLVILLFNINIKRYT
jgi:hypothetical protein